MSLFSKMMVSLCGLMLAVATLAAQPSFRMQEVVGPEALASVSGKALSDKGHVLGIYGDINRKNFIYQPYTGMRFLEGDILYPSDINSNGFAVGGAYPHWFYGKSGAVDLSTSGSGGIFLNDQFQLAGRHFVGSNQTGFFQKSLDESEPISITIEGFNSTEVTGLNNAGQVIGLAKKYDGKYYAYVFDAANGATLLDISPGPFDRAEAYAINDKGDIVAGNKVQMWYLHAESGAQELIYAPGGGFIKGVGINNIGQVIGSYGSSGPATPFFWVDGNAYDLVDLIWNFPPDLTLSSAVAINNRGQILVTTRNNFDRLQSWVLSPRRFDAEEAR